MDFAAALLLVPARDWSASTWSLFLVVAIIWGLNYIFVNIGLAFSSPLWLAALRAVFGLVGSAGILAVIGGGGKLDRRGKRDAVLIGLPNITVFFACWFLAAGRILPGVAAVTIYTFPLWVALLSAPVLHQRLTARHWASVTVGFLGIVLVSQIGEFTGTRLPLVPIVELLVAAFAWAMATVVIQRRFRPSEMLEANVYQLVGGTGGLLVLALVAAPSALPEVTQPELWATVLWLGVLGTAIAYSVWFYLLGRTRAATLSAYLFLVPVVAFAASAVVFGERLTYLQLVGVLCVLASIYGIGRAPGNSDSAGVPEARPT
ncbi:MAG TPA: EamA family transporter [Thermoplasmata archaeon]|nr:EamA family transporter [Thermoplasmata archaeon]